MPSRAFSLPLLVSVALVGCAAKSIAPTDWLGVEGGAGTGLDNTDAGDDSTGASGGDNSSSGGGSGTTSSGSGGSSGSSSSGGSRGSSGSSSGTRPAGSSSGSSGSGSAAMSCSSPCTSAADCQRNCGATPTPGYSWCCGASTCYQLSTVCPPSGSGSGSIDGGSSNSSGGSSGGSGSGSSSGARRDGGGPCGAVIQPCCAGLKCNSGLVCLGVCL